MITDSVSLKLEREKIDDFEVSAETVDLVIFERRSMKTGSLLRNSYCLFKAPYDDSAIST